MKAMKRTKSLVAIAAGMCLAGVVMAQSTTGNIFGTVPAGTVVTLSGTTGISRTVTAGADGKYNMASLPAGEYKVEAKGFAARTVTVTVGGGTDVSFVNNLETVTVTGSSTRIAAIDVSQTDTRTVFTADVLSKIAVGRSVNQVALLAPGVTNSVSYNVPSTTSNLNNPLGRAGAQNIGSFGGSAASENAYYINGYPVTNPLLNIGATTLAFDSISQVQVFTGGYGAEYGRSTGGVVSLITKRGTNEWKSGVYAIWSPKSLRSDPKDIYYPDTGKWSQANHYNSTVGNNPNNWTDGTLYQRRSQNTFDGMTFGAYAGGPIIKDRLFIYANVEQTRNEVDGVRVTRTGALTASNAAQAWSESKNTYPRGTVKVDWNITDNHLLELTAIQDNAKEAYAYYGYDYTAATKNGTKYLNADHVLSDKSKVYVAKYTGNFTDNLSGSVTLGQQKIDHAPDLAGYVDGKNWVTISPTSVPSQFASISNPQGLVTIADPGTDKTQGARFDLTYILGKHEVRVGYDRFKAESYLASRNSGPNNVRWIYGVTDPNSAIDASSGIGSPASAGGLGAQGYYVDQLFSASGSAVSTTQKAFYIEDRFQVTDRLLLSLGFRSDSFINYNGDKKPYVEQKNNKAPRLGFSWDVNGNASLKVFGNAGRYFLAIPNNVAIRGASATLNADKYYTYTSIAADGTPQGLTQIVPTATDSLCAAGTPAAGAVSANQECGQVPDPATVAVVGLKPHYQDEYIFGMEQALNKQWSWGAKGTYRDLKNAIDDTCAGALCRIFNPGLGATFKSPDGNGGYTYTTLTAEQMGLPKLKRKYYSVDLFAAYQDARMYGKVQYTWSRNYGNAEGQLNSSLDTGAGGQPDVSTSSDWDLPQIMEGSYGALPNNHTHSVKLFGSYRLTDEWRVGGSAIFQSGSPRSCTSWYPYAAPGLYSSPIYYHYCGVPGSQTASSTPVAPNAGYAFSPRGTYGTTPWTKTFNVSVGYSPDYVKGLTLQADVLNLFNTQTPTAYYSASASLTAAGGRGTANQQFGRTLYYTDPRSVRLTGRYDF
ncbi:TonB-dependent receptor [Roseateles sp.]|uniref:TonB-dependent receptor n=1 Tax=Roseateles sp. TaxID=1971397 RepID=UPI003BAC71B7